MMIWFWLITPWEFILSAVPVAVLFTLILIYVIGAYWREETRAKIKVFGGQLRENQQQINQAEVRLRPFSQIKNHHPYAAPYAQAAAVINRAKSMLQTHFQQYSNLHQEIADQMVNTAKTVLTSPYLWFETRRKQERFERDLHKFSSTIHEIETLLSTLENVGQATAHEAQVSWQQVQELGNILQTLAQRQIHGERFTQVQQRYIPIHSKISQIPAYFLNAGSDLASDAFNNHQEVIRVHELLNKYGTELRSLLHDCQNWEAQHNLVYEQLRKLSDQQQEIAQRLGLLPVAIDSTPLLTSLNECRAQIRSIREKARRIEADELRLLLRETRQISRVLGSLMQEVTQTHGCFDRYQQLRSQLDAEWQHIKSLAYRLSQSPFLPLEMDETGKMLNSIHKEYSTLPALNAQQTPQQLREVLTRVHNLLDTCQHQAPEMEILQNAHAECIVLVRRLKGAEMENWITSTLQANQALSQYPASNYHIPAHLKDRNLETDLEEILQSSVKELPNLTDNVRESQLLKLLTDAKSLEEKRAWIADHLKDQTTQLEQLKQKEANARTLLLQVEETLDTLDSMPGKDESTNTLRKLAQTFRKQWQPLQSAMDQPQTGILQDKTRSIELLYQALSEDLQVQWKSLQLNDKAQKDSLHRLTQSILAMASITDEQLQQALDFLDEDKNDQDTRPQASDLDDLTADIKNILEKHYELTELHQNAAALFHQMQETIKPMETAHEHCQQKIDAGSQFIDTKSWNQRSLNFDRLRKELASLDEHANRFHSTSIPFRQFQLQTNQLSQRYHELEKRIDQVIGEAEDEHRRQKEAEAAFASTISRWQRLAEQNRADHTFYQAAQDLLSIYQQQYRQEQKQLDRGNINADTYLKIIHKIIRTLDTEAITTADNRLLDINGRELH